VRNPLELPLLAGAQLLGWADAYGKRTGSWPQFKSGAIAESRGKPGTGWTGLCAKVGETWLGSLLAK